MKKALIISLLLITPVFAQEEPLDPVAVVKQLYLSSAKNSKTDASFGIWADGSVNFSVNYGGRYENKTLYGSGNTPREALNSLIRQSEALSKQIVPQAEKDKSNILSIAEAAKSILNSKQPSQ